MSGPGQDPRSHDPATRETVPPGGKNESTTATTAIPDRLGRYTIQRTLGAGGMGVVYLAHDEQLDRQVALKIPTAKVADSPKLLERLHREARSAATLSHANICQVYDVGEIEGHHFISMAFIDGRPLSDFIRPGKQLPQRQAAALIRRVALALEHAHENGVIHRDLKPSNIMVNSSREPIVMDFGLARQFDKDADSRLTQQGGILGSPAYMSPEQVDGDVDRIGPTSDVYSLGVVLYELLTARLPFEGSMASILGQILTSEPVPPSELRPDLSSQLEEICLKMMARDIDERYASMGQVAVALRQALKQTHGVEPSTTKTVELSAFGGGDDEYEFLSQRREAAQRTLWLEKSRKFWIRATVVGLLCALVVWLVYRFADEARTSITGSPQPRTPASDTESAQARTTASITEPAQPQRAQPATENGRPKVTGPRELARVLAPFNSSGRDAHPWMSSDGLSLFWDRGDTVWLAARLSPKRPFGQARLVGPGRHPTVSGDLLELIVLQKTESTRRPVVLGVSSRATSDAPFGPVRVITELRDQTNVKSPMLSHDGLSLVFECGPLGQRQLVVSRRANRLSRWEEPTSLPVRPGIYGNKPLTWVFVTRDRLTLFCCYGGGPFNEILVAKRETENQPFAGFQTIHVDNRPVRGRSPRYVESTGELFFSTVPSPQESKNSELWVIRNYSP